MMRLIIIGLILWSVSSSPSWADNQKPSSVKGLSAESISNDAIRVSWNKPWDNVGVVGYNVYRNGAYHATVFSTNYIDKSVKNNSEYRYGIVAFDEARNYTTVSYEVSVSTGGSNDNGSNNQVAPPPPEPVRNNGEVNTPDGLFAEIQNGNSAKIKWRAPRGDIKGYNVYKNGSYVTTVDSPEYYDDSLNWGEDYRYHVTAISREIRFSAKSGTLTVNTANGSSTQNN